MNTESEKADNRQPTQIPGREIATLRTLVIALFLIWTVVMGVSLTVEIIHENKHTRKLAKKEAVIAFNKDVAFRLWASTHGGVYVPANERTPPNPNLSHIPERDIVTPSGRSLTLMNPAYALRQIMSEFSELYGPRGHITSMNPLNPFNAPNDWERTALLSFERGEKEFFEFVEENDVTYLRLMRPLVTQKTCLNCHAKQGYKEGDIRGGIGVSLDMKAYFQLRDEEVRKQIITHSGIWILGMVGIGFGARKGRGQILKRQQAEKKEQEAELKYQDIYENAPDMFVSVEAKTGEIVRCNQTLVDNLGYLKSEIIGKNILEVYHPDCLLGAEKAFHSFVETGEVHDTELQLQRKDGSKIEVSLRVSAVRDEAGKVLFSRSIWRDITEKKVVEQELKQSYEKLEQRVKERTAELEIARDEAQSADRLKTLFMASMSHELRTPLNSIIGFTGVLLEGMAGKINPRQTDYLGRAHQSSKHLLSLISDIIDISKIESGRVDAFPELFNLRDVVDEAADSTYAQELKSKEIELKVEVPSGLEIYSDRKRVLQCVLNFLSNACKFTESGSITISAQEVEDEVAIVFEDTGIGISEADLPKLFKQFERLDTKYRITKPGTGLGLYLTKKLATEVLGGSVVVESRLGVGSKFILKIPKKFKQQKSKRELPHLTVE